MKLIHIIIYLGMIVIVEGTLHEYVRSTSSPGDRGCFHTVQHNLISHVREKERAHSLLEGRTIWRVCYEMLVMIIQSIWGLLIGSVRWVWHGMHEWIELILVIFECTKLVHKVVSLLHM